MTTAFKLIAKALRAEAPPRVVLFGLLNKLNYLLRTGNRRFEFERLYLEEFDPWRYHSSPYEQEKYRFTLDRLLELRRADKVALEVGCSLGVFSSMLADHFGEAVSIDISAEVLRQARTHNAGRKHLRFVRSDIQSLNLRLHADVITCAEVLYYIREQDAPAVCESLKRHLSPDGVIIYVSGLGSGEASDFYFDDWANVLGQHFHLIERVEVIDVERPYEFIAFEHRH